MPRVLHITRDFPPHGAGGISTAVGGIVGHAMARDVPTAVISFDGWRPRSAPRSEPRTALETRPWVHRIGDPHGLDDANAFGRDFAPNILHVHEPVLWSFTAELGAHLKARTLLTLHVIQHEVNRLRRVETTHSSQAEHQALEAADLLHAGSTFAAASVTRAFPMAASKIRLASLGIDDTAVARASREGRLAAPTSGPVTYVGRFADLKGTDTLIDMLAGHATAFDLKVVGGIPHSAKREARWRERFSRAAGGRSVELLGWLSGAKLEDRYRQASVLVVPSRLETFGLTALEGLLHGIPLLVADCPGLTSWLEDGRTALFFKSGDPDDLGCKLQELLADPGLRQGLGHAGAAHVLASYLWQDRIGGILRIYDELV